MGAEQSSTRSGNGQSAAVVRKTCYYELMGVERSATDEEIRKAYKRKALELHPDRNFNDVDNATRRFAEVQTAYEVLSDPQERAWYDSHRDAILSGDPQGDGDAVPTSQYNNIRITTSEEIYALIGRFNSSVPMNDSPNGFFAILDDFFGHLAQEEAAACEWDGLETPEYPPFGSSTDPYDPVARLFYNAWSSFATRKSFSWRDKYRLSDAPDRRVRRLMEKENKKARDDAIRDFNDAVRSLAAFVKKRDPRYVPNTQSEAERQRILRDSAAAQAARSRAANQEKLAEYVLPAWAQARNDADQHEGDFSEVESESEVEEIECVVCSKTFKSEKQFEAHEKSKKHQKAVQQLRRQMKKENIDFDLQEDSDGGGDPAPAHAPPTAYANSDSVARSENDASREEAATSEGKTENTADTREPLSKSSRDGAGDDSSQDSLLSGDDEYAPRAQVEKRIIGSGARTHNPLDPDQGDVPSIDDLSIEDASPAGKKVGKAKQKREKKAARQAALTDQGALHVCNICQASFPSRTKMFTHIDQEHSAPKPGKGGKKSKR